MLPKGWRSYSKRQLIDIVNEQKAKEQDDTEPGIDDTVNKLIMSNVIAIDKHRHRGGSLQGDFAEDKSGLGMLKANMIYDIDYISSDNKKESSDDDCDPESSIGKQTN